MNSRERAPSPPSHLVRAPSPPAPGVVNMNVSATTRRTNTKTKLADIREIGALFKNQNNLTTAGRRVHHLQKLSNNQRLLQVQQLEVGNNNNSGVSSSSTRAQSSSSSSTANRGANNMRNLFGVPQLQVDPKKLQVEMGAARRAASPTQVPVTQQAQSQAQQSNLRALFGVGVKQQPQTHVRFKETGNDLNVRLNFGNVSAQQQQQQ